MIYNIHDTIITKKNHACGGNEWEILRTGCDVKIKCKKCGKILMLDLNKFKKSVKIHIPKGE